jgi:hypothetical protein
MKKRFYTLGICIALFVGCSPGDPISSVLFVSPQLEGAEELQRLPKRLLGQYWSKRDSSQLSIYPDAIYSSKQYQWKVPVMELDSTCILIGDSIIRDKESKADLPVKRLGDTLYWTFDKADTLFKLDENHILKRYKAIWILNSRQEEGWLLTKLEKKNKQLTWSYIDSVEINQLKKLSDSYIDSVPFQFKISSTKFKEFISAQGFTDIDTFEFKSRLHKSYLK